MILEQDRSFKTLFYGNNQTNRFYTFFLLRLVYLRNLPCFGMIIETRSNQLKSCKNSSLSTSDHVPPLSRHSSTFYSNSGCSLYGRSFFIIMSDKRVVEQVYLLVFIVTVITFVPKLLVSALRKSAQSISAPTFFFLHFHRFFS